MEIPIPQDIAQKVQEMRTKPYRRKEKALEKLLKKKHHGVIDATKLTPAGYAREKRLQFKEQMSGHSEDDNSWAKHALAIERFAEKIMPKAGFGKKENKIVKQFKAVLARSKAKRTKERKDQTNAILLDVRKLVELQVFGDTGAVAEKPPGLPTPAMASSAPSAAPTVSPIMMLTLKAVHADCVRLEGSTRICDENQNKNRGSKLSKAWREKVLDLRSALYQNALAHAEGFGMYHSIRKLLGCLDIARPRSFDASLECGGRYSPI